MTPNESTAEAVRDRGETTDADRAYLRALCPPGATVYTILRHRSRSGMSRTIALFVVATDGFGRPDVRWLPSSRLARLGLGRDDTKRDGTVVHGSGMDMGYDLVYRLSRALYAGDGSFVLAREFQDARLSPPMEPVAANAGYLLKHRWL